MAVPGTSSDVGVMTRPGRTALLQMMMMMMMVMVMVMIMMMLMLMVMFLLMMIDYIRC